MRLKKIGVSLCLIAMAGVIFNLSALACETPGASNKGTTARQQSPYTQVRQVQSPAKAPAQKKQPKSPAAKAPVQKQQPKNPAPKPPAQKQPPKSSAPKGPVQKQPQGPSAQEIAQVQALRQQINTLNAQVLSLKTQARNDISKIRADLAKVAFDPTVRQSQDYKTVVDTLNKVNSELASAEKIDYCAKLASVTGKYDSSPVLSSVVTQLNTKISDLTAVVNELNAVLPTADALNSQKQAAQQAWQQFLTQADAKKKTIDSNSQQIAAVNKSCQDAVNEIVATAAANKDILAGQSGMGDIVAQLGAVMQGLLAENNGRLAAAGKIYDQDLKDKNYSGALSQLDAIISIQNNRLSVEQSAFSQLQSVLNTLQNLVAAVSASSASSAASGQAT